MKNQTQKQRILASDASTHKVAGIVYKGQMASYSNRGGSFVQITPSIPFVKVS